MTRPVLLLWLGLVGCQGQPVAEADLAAESLAPRDDLADCDAIAFAEAADICRLDLSVRLARKQDAAGAAAGCGAVQGVLWKEECHFRIAEVLGRRVGLATALTHCDQAERYARFCFIHAAWWARDFASLGHPADPSAAASIDRFIQSLHAAAPEVRSVEWKNAMEMLRASAWFSLYYGSGTADPTAAQAASGPDLEFARTAFSWEATRLIAASDGWTDLPAAVAASWAGQRPPPTGSTMAPHCWQGRIPDVTHAQELDAVPRSHTAHGGLRLVGETPGEDLTIATLEAMFFNPAAPPEMWAPLLDHPAARVRATVGRLGVMAEAQDEAWRSRLSALEEPALRGQILAARNREVQHWTASPDRADCP